MTHPHSRHPAVNLVAITTVDELSGGRAIYGIGTGDRPVTELGLAPARVGAVRDMGTGTSVDPPLGTGLVLAERRLAPGEAFTDEHVWTRGSSDFPRLGPGRYAVRGVLLATGNTIRSVPVAVELP